MKLPKLPDDAPDLLDTQAEMVVKSAPDFFYPDEMGHIHFEALLCPAPMLVYKERQETRLLPPPARPMGEFFVRWAVADASAAMPLAGGQELPATPLEGLRRKLRVSLPGSGIESRAKAGQTRLLLRLAVGDAEVETQKFRLLHTATPWPGQVVAGSANLFFDCDCAKPLVVDAGAAERPSACERVMLVVPSENEAEYRKYAPLKAISERVSQSSALFVGDPLVERSSVDAAGDKPVGVAKSLADLMPKTQWDGVYVPGPHRNLPVYQMIGSLDAYMRAHEGKVPPLAVISIGSGDAERQTPLHNFERAVDVLVDRLRIGGAKHILVIGVVPMPERERQYAPYHERLTNVLRLHHVDCVDVFGTFAHDAEFWRSFSADGSDKMFGPVPNAAAREKIAQMTRDRL